MQVSLAPPLRAFCPFAKDIFFCQGPSRRCWVCQLVGWLSGRGVGGRQVGGGEDQQGHQDKMYLRILVPLLVRGWQGGRELGQWKGCHFFPSIYEIFWAQNFWIRNVHNIHPFFQALHVYSSRSRRQFWGTESRGRPLRGTGILETTLPAPFLCESKPLQLK